MSVAHALAMAIRGVATGVRMDRLGLRVDDVSSALLGPTIGRALRESPATVVATGRRGDGFFRHESERMRNRHVAGVLLFSTELRPWSVAREAPVLWLHPEPERPLPQGLPWSRVDRRADEPHDVDGTFDPSRVFELPDVELFDDPHDWPGKPFESLQ